MSEANDAEKDGEIKERDATSSDDSESAASDGDDATSPEATTDGEAVTGEATSAPVRKKKKKKKKKPGAEPAAPAKKEGPEYDVSGAERAAFLAWFPEDPELDQLARAFEVGNYAYVREHAAKLAEKSEDEKVRAAARELLARIEPDPLMKFLLLGAVALLVFLTLYAYQSHAH
jgi:hypothetical protein